MTRTIVSVIASLAIGAAGGSVATQHFMLQVTCSAPDDDSAARDAMTKRWLGPDHAPAITAGKGY